MMARHQVSDALSVFGNKLILLLSFSFVGWRARAHALTKGQPPHCVHSSGAGVGAAKTIVGTAMATLLPKGRCHPRNTNRESLVSR